MIFGHKINIDFLGEVSLFLGLAVQVASAVFIGFVIGLNRELNNKAAGIKTNIMICLGATIYTSLSLLNIDPSLPGQDPNRMAAQIVSGIGFLGAGAIMRGDGHISGLTTAATIWVVAALGVAIGFGYPSVSLICAFVVILILVGTNRIYSIFLINKNYKVKIISETSVSGIIKGVVLNSSVDLIKVFENKPHEEENEDSNYRKTKIIVEANNKTIKSFIRLIKKIKAIKKVDYYIID